MLVFITEHVRSYLLKIFIYFQNTINYKIIQNLSLIIITLIMSKKQDFFWNDVQKNLLEAQYAVRGVVPILAFQIKNQLAQGSKQYPFNEVTFCNIGNPQEFGQKPITFNRETISCAINPSLIQMPNINPDAKKRAKWYLDNMMSVGSYTHSFGVPIIRKSVAKFLAKQDGIQQPSIQNIILTDGASQGVHMISSSIITDFNDGIMIPIPQYPLYSATTTLYGGSMVPYYLNEETGWQLDPQELQRSLSQAKKNNKKVKCIVVINPGNPTGAIFSEQTIKNIITFAIKNKLLIIADQVYRQNIYKIGAKFVSFRRVLHQMGQQAQNTCQLASLHSVSKGLLGECGLRGGYLYLHNINPEVLKQLLKLKSINLCSNTIGQISIQLMVNPPLDNVTDQTKKTYLAQMKGLLDSLKMRAKYVTQSLKSMKNIEVNEVEGSMYSFPRIKFSRKAIQAAGDKSPDLFYCLQVLKNTGIALVPGSGFGQKPGTYHFRITTLILPQEKLRAKLEELKKFNNAFHEKYAEN